MRTVTDVPTPPEWTEELVQQIEEEAREWVKAFRLMTAEMERFSSEDLLVIVS